MSHCHALDERCSHGGSQGVNPLRAAFLDQLPDHERTALIASGTLRTFVKGEAVFRRAGDEDLIALILHGRAEVTVAGDGAPVSLATRGRGDLVDANAMLGGSPLAAAVTALEPLAAVLFTRDEFEYVLRRHPRISTVLLKVTTARLREFDLGPMRRTESGLVEYLAALLLDLSPGADIRCEIVGYTQQQIAAALGVSPSSLSRAVRELREAGAIHTDRDHRGVIRINDRTRLAALAAKQPAESSRTPAA